MFHDDADLRVYYFPKNWGRHSEGKFFLVTFSGKPVLRKPVNVEEVTDYAIAEVIDLPR